MQLRRLAINGFKTFAGKSEFEFKGGITAVVGPNGSGKSNLSDAIRWALGEQSARLLRGTSMSDVIFAGTTSRKASGMAEVTVVIDNSDRALSLDFDEVSVTRRVYRDGDSQFLMNGVECRLKDISELFAGTGLGKEAYAAIEQGKVDAIISSQPQDRRGIFDEASGIMRYKNRKRDAERKLIDVEERTSRASDILSELKQKEPVLEKQALDAQTYKDAVSESRSLEFASICLETAEAHKRLLLLETELSMKVAERERLQAELTLSEASYETARLKAAELSISFETASQTAQAASKSAVKHEMRAMELESDLSSMHVMLSRANEDLTGQFEEGLKTQAALEAVRSRRSGIGEKLAALDNEICGRAEQVAKLQGEANELDRRIDEFRAEHFQRVSKVAGIKNMIGANTQRQESLRARSNRIKGSYDALLAEKSLSSGRASELSADIAALKAEIGKLEGELAENKNEYSKLNVDLGKEVLANATMAKDLARCETVLATLESMQNDMEGYAASVKEVFSEAGMGRLSGIISTVGDAISVPKGLEAAIESALGSQVNDIICSTADTASASISYLRTRSCGRATFLPLDIIRASKLNISERLSTAKGFLGLASDMVSYEERLRPAFEYLLGGTAVFNSLDDAISSQKQGIRVRIVTVDGELISSGGAITGGSRNELKGSVISRRRKIADLLEEKAKKSDELEKGKDAERSINEKLGALESVRMSLEKVLTETDRALRDAELEISKSESYSVQLSDQIAASLEELEGIDKELNSGDLDTAELKLALIEAERAVGEHGDRNDFDRSVKTALSEKLTEASRQHTELLVEKATIESLALSLNLEEDSLVARISSQGDKSSDLRRTICELENKIGATRAEAEKEREVCSQFASQQEACTRDAEKFKADRDAFETEAASLEQSLKNKRRRLAQAGEAESQRAMERARVQGEYAVLSSKLEKDHGISFEQADEASFQGLDKTVASARIDELKSIIETLGDINMAASEELTAMKDRILFMGGQIEDLDKARLSLSQVIKEAERTAKKQFAEMFELIRQNFKDIFERLFAGGQADIVLTDDEEPLESGIEIICRPPGKKLSQLSLLSGGEKALAAIALIFSFLKARPAPFCMLDEIDAALDDANVDRFRELVSEYANQSQMIIITHRRRTMEAAARVYGVTMEENGVSKAVCVDTSEIIFQEGLVE